MRDTVIIGAGINGLIAAALMAKAGMRPLVVERAERVGGCAITSEIAPGFRCSTLSHWAAIDPGLVGALDLQRHGLQIIRSPAVGCVPALDGPAVTLWRDPREAAREVAGFSARDAARYPEFLASLGAIGGVLRTLMAAPAPVLDRPGAGDLFELLKTGRRFRALGRTDAYRLLRWLPMPVIDFAGEWFESAPLRMAIAAGGVFGSLLGPRSAGSTAIFLLLAARHDHPMDAGWTAHGGIGAIADAVAAAARQAGVEIRTGTEVAGINVEDGRAQGITLRNGEEIRARAVVSSTGPEHPHARGAHEDQLRGLDPAAVRRLGRQQ
jgi:phytoene dehydrogenase-like protein